MFARQAAGRGSGDVFSWRAGAGDAGVQEQGDSCQANGWPAWAQAVENTCYSEYAVF